MNAELQFIHALFPCSRLPVRLLAVSRCLLEGAWRTPTEMEMLELDGTSVSVIDNANAKQTLFYEEWMMWNEWYVVNEGARSDVFLLLAVIDKVTRIHCCCCCCRSITSRDNGYGHYEYLISRSWFGFIHSFIHSFWMKLENVGLPTSFVLFSFFFLF